MPSLIRRNDRASGGWAGARTRGQRNWSFTKVVYREQLAIDAWGWGMAANDPRERSLRRILLAEDDEDMRRFLVKALAKAGYDVVSFGNGLEAY